MSWEGRSGTGRRYYFRAQRVAGQIVKQYIGSSGNLAVQVVARSDRLMTAEQGVSVAASRAEAERYREAEERFMWVQSQIDAVIRASCVLAARPIPHQIRFRRRSKQEPKMSERFLPPALPPRQQIDVLASKAAMGNDDAAAELRALLAQHPHIWRSIADLAGFVEATFIELISDRHPVMTESLQLKTDEYRRELAEPTDGRLEQLVIERIVASWLDVQHQQVAAQQSRQRRSVTQIWQQSLSRAQRRLFDAIKLLTELRAQVNP
jgi:hypothetical protein